MTENEAIEKLKFVNEKCLEQCEGACSSRKNNDCACQDAVIERMLDELLQYREIGTVEQCREAMEKQKVKKCIEDSYPDHTYYKCPSCGKIQKTKYDNSTFGCILNNCSNCGQALEMEVEDD